jgi:hypothetical protein
MAEGNERDGRRRDFLRSVLRWPLAGALGLAAGRLIGGRGPLKPGETCVNRGACRGCAALPRCDLPQAALARKAPY